MKNLKEAEEGRKAIRTLPIEELPPAPKTIEDCCEWLSFMAVAVASGRIDSKTGDVVARTLNTLFRGIKDSHISAKVDELKSVLAEARRSGGIRA